MKENRDFVRKIVAVAAAFLVFSSVAATPVGAQDLIELEEVDIEEALEEAEEVLSAQRQDLAAELPAETASDEIVNAALLTDIDRFIEPMPLTDAQVDVIGDEVVLSNGDAGDSTVFTLHRRLVGGHGGQPHSNGARAGLDDDGGDIVFETTANTMRIMEVIPERRSTHQFRYHVEIDGQVAQLQLGEDGSVAVGLSSGNGRNEVFDYYGGIDPAWVVDTNGEQVEVAFDVIQGGQELRLRVPRQQAQAYPLVADPNFSIGSGIVSCGWTSCTAYWDVKRTQEMYFGFRNHSTVVAVGIAASIICGGLGIIASANPIVGLVVATGCAGLVASQSFWINHHTNIAIGRSPDGCTTSRLGGWRVLTTGNVARSHAHCHWDV